MLTGEVTDMYPKHPRNRVQRVITRQHSKREVVVLRVELKTPESEPSRRLRKWRLIQFPQLTI